MDDDASVLELITAILEDGGYDTVHSGSAEEAFAVLQRQTRDLVGVRDRREPGTAERLGYCAPCPRVEPEDADPLHYRR